MEAATESSDGESISSTFNRHYNKRRKRSSVSQSSQESDRYGDIQSIASENIESGSSKTKCLKTVALFILIAIGFYFGLFLIISHNVKNQSSGGK